MKTTPHTFSSPFTHNRRAAFLAAASLFLAAALPAQTQPPAPAAKAAQASDQPAPGQDNSRKNEATAIAENGTRLHSLKFDGRNLEHLVETLKKAFPEDSVVVAGFVGQMELSAFEIRNVQLSEIARTIEFISEGQLGVEVVENNPSASANVGLAGLPPNHPVAQKLQKKTGNIWRIGRKNPATAAAPLKMRSVSAPHLFADKEKLAEVLSNVKDIERDRAGRNLEMGDRLSHYTRVMPLNGQNVLVLMGDEDGIAGVESLIKVTEQGLALADAARKAKALAELPKTRAVIAPHLFAEPARLDNIKKEIDRVQHMWMVMRSELQERANSRDVFFPMADAEPYERQKVFILMGAEDAMAGLESLILAAEKLASEEDAEAAQLKKSRAAEDAALKAPEKQEKPEKRGE